ncbi:alpha/beta hydrolase [Promicromonospora sukumoe]
MRRTRMLVLAGALAAVMTVPAAVPVAAAPEVSAAGPSTVAGPAPRTLLWAPCPADVVTPLPLECSTLDVPLDYSRPDGRQIEIAISRLASTEPAQRRGVLLTNPGGPGIAGLAYPAELAVAGLPQDVLGSYDVIGMDPRGVGRSAPVTCDSTPEQQALGSFPQYAGSILDVTREARYARTVAEQCATSSTAWTMPHITTANTARDLDRVRAALGEEKASYLGASYGSYLGAVYTTLFPDTSDRVVIDSVLGPDGYDVQQMRRFARGLQDRFPDFAEYAAAHPEYGLGTTPEQVEAKFYELVEKLEANPQPDMDAMKFRVDTFGYLYSDATIPVVAKMWRLVDTGQPQPVIPAGDHDNLLSARLYVICGDQRWPETMWRYQLDVAVDRARYPMLGGSTANIGPCAFWPDVRTEQPTTISDRGPSNVLMVQNERDPGAALAGAEETRQAFGRRATMVTVDGGGHGVYPWTTSTCAKDAVTTYLTTGERPARDLVCAPA